jgi:thiol-disulfide isomerase/thioredoxin
MKFFAWTLSLAVCLGATTAWAQDAPDAPPVPNKAEEGQSLTLGNNAPPLAIGEWLRGDEVTKFEPGQVYVVEFWATWCPPCRASMPHLSELQAEYGKKVIFIGVSDEDKETVTGFFGQESPVAGEDEAAKTWDEVINYTIALDAADGTGKAYMQASGQSGIPTAFIVGKDGKIEWIGHPMQIDEPIAAVVAGTWDREAAIKAMEEEKRAEEAARAAMREIQQAVQAKDFDTAVKVVDNLIKEFPDNENFPMIRLQIVAMSGDSAALGTAIEQQAQKSWDDAEALNGLVWMFVGRGKTEGLPIDSLKKIAEHAAEITEYKDGSVLDTLARVYYQAGDLDKAIEWQEKAVANGGEMAEQLQESLDSYKKEKAAGNEEPAADEAA